MVFNYLVSNQNFSIMKIINRTDTGLVCTFVYGNGSGCGFIGPGETLDKDLDSPINVLISTNDPITYNQVQNQTIVVSSSIS